MSSPANIYTRVKRLEQMNRRLATANRLLAAQAGALRDDLNRVAARLAAVQAGEIRRNIPLRRGPYLHQPHLTAAARKRLIHSRMSRPPRYSTGALA